MKKPTHKEKKQQELNMVDTIDQYHQLEESWRKERIVLTSKIEQLERIIKEEESLKLFCQRAINGKL